jgi:serine-type D-Ala-D-Ala carboxypeptidase (penicillin-binding protein 5/6)
MRAFLAGLLVMLCAASSFAAEKQDEPDFTTAAPHAIVVDATTGEVFFEKAADDTFEPASMSKLMTMAMVFDALGAGALKEDDLITISEDAWRRGGAPSGGSTMYAEVKSQVPVRDLMRGVVVQSANDAAIAFAERLGGSEPAFAEKMTARGREIGLQRSTFRNATGLPDPEHLSTARDLSILARHIIRNWPQYYPLYGEREFTWNRITQRNRNPLLGVLEGADGMKTGYTSKAGYGLIGSAIRGGRRLVVVVAGLETAQTRAKEAQNLLEQGFKKYRSFDLLTPEEPLVRARIWGGTQGTVRLVAREPLKARLTDAERSAARVVVDYKGPLVAPVSKDTRTGTARLMVGDVEIASVPVYPRVDVGAQDGIIGRSLDTLGFWAFGG